MSSQWKFRLDFHETKEQTKKRISSASVLRNAGRMLLKRKNMPQFPIHESKYFDVREFVHPDTFVICPNPEQQIDRRIVRCSDLLREKIDLPVVINNYHYWKPGKQSKYVSSGHRSKNDKTGALYSQHRAGRASDNRVFGCPVSSLSEKAKSLLDILVSEKLTTYERFEKRGYTSDMLLRVVLMNLSEFIEAGLTTVEDPAYTHGKQDWLHMDCRERRPEDSKNEIRIVQP